MTSDSVSLAQLVDWLSRFHSLVSERHAHLAVGTAAVMERLATVSPQTIDELFKAVSMTFVSSAGRASGPAYGTFFLRFGMSAGEVASLNAQALGTALRAGLEGVVARGDAAAGDTTMVDALAPAVEAYDAAVAAGSDLATALSLAVRGVDSAAAPSLLLFEALASAVVVQ